MSTTRSWLNEVTGSFEVKELNPDQWQRLRALRLASLNESPEAFGGDPDAEEMWGESEWRAKFEQFTYLAGVMGNRDIAVLSVENLEGDFGATCWVGGCWVHPEFRGKGVMRRLINYLDEHARERGWTIQGLGVFADNIDAIESYEQIGFERMGELQPSTRRPGRFFQRMIRDSAKFTHGAR
ncbi:MAG: GNAT family N-acetyltransferase [Candidatus Nanopelagicaceae bacterium]